MIPDPERCYENMITLQLIMVKLYPNANIIEIRDAFSEAVFSGVIDKERINAIKRNTNKNAFYNDNIRWDKGKRKFHVAKTVKAFRNALEEPSLRRKTYTQLVKNCKAILSDTENHGIHITAELFDFVTGRNAYSEKTYRLIQQCIAKNRFDSALALIIIIAVFQEESPRIISVKPDLIKLLTASASEKSLEASVIYKAAAEMLERAASEQGRMLAFRDVKNKIGMPEVGAIVPDILGKCRMRIDNFSNEQSKPLTAYFDKPPCSNIMLIGCGGSGKTFSLIYLGENLLQDKSNIIPFYIPLSALNAKRTADGSPVLRYFFDILSEYADIQEDAIRTFFKTETEVTVLFLLDGYNEITDSSVKTDLIAEIKQIRRDFRAVRFVLTGRYDISESFATGGSLPFMTKQLLPLNDSAINSFLKKQNIHYHDIRPELMDLLRNPMALAMYAHIHSEHDNSGINLYLPYPQPETLGELMGNFIEQIKCTPSLRGNSEIRIKIHTTMSILYCIAGKMVQNGKYRITEFELNRYFHEAVRFYRTYAGLNISEEFFPEFIYTEKKMGFLVYSQHGDVEYRFYHQNFRDYFYALFLFQTVQCAVMLTEIDHASACTLLCDTFSKEISNELLQLFGEAALERTFLPEYNRDSQELSVIEQGLAILQGKHTNHNAQYAVNALIRAACLARKNDMSVFHFDGLDLTSVSLNGVSLYSIHDGRIFTASFHSTYLNESTFMPNGLMAAVHTFVKIDNHILSIAADGIWSHNTKAHSHRFVTICNGTYITVSAYSAKHQLLFTGDKNGWVRTWKCSYDMWGNICLTEQSELAFSLSDIVRQILIDEERDFCIIGVKGDDICFFPIAHSEQKQYIRLCANILRTPRYRLRLDGEHLYLASGLSVYKVHRDVLQITENDLIKQLQYDDDAHVFDFIIMNVVLDKHIIFNIRGRNRSAIIALSGTESRIIRENQHTSDWCGFNKLSELDGSLRFCICNNIGNPKHPAVTEVTYNLLRNDFICHDYYGNQSMEIYDCCYAGQDEIMISSIDRSMQIINTRTESVTARFPGYNPGIHHMHILSPDMLLACTYDGAFLRLQRSYADGKWQCMQNKAAHDGWANEICGFSYDDTLYAAVCGNDGNVSIWNIEEETRLITIESDNSITSVCHLFDRYLLTTNRIGKITIYELDTKSRTYSVAQRFSPRRQSVRNYLNFYAQIILSDHNTAGLLILSVSASKNSRIYRMDIQNGTELSIEIHELFSWNNTRIRTLSSIFSAERNQYIYMAAGTRYLPDEAEYLAVFSDDGVIADIVNKRDSEYKKLRCDTMTENIGFLSGTLFTHNNRLYIAAASYSHMLHIYQLDDHRLTEITTVHIGFPSIDIKFSDGSLYLTALSGKLLEIPVYHLLSGDIPADPEDYTVFQNVSGLYLNHVDLSDCHCDFGDGFKEIIRRYQARM